MTMLSLLRELFLKYFKTSWGWTVPSSAKTCFKLTLLKLTGPFFTKLFGTNISMVIICVYQNVLRQSFFGPISFLNPKIFQTKNIIGSNKNLNHIFFGLHIFLGQNFVWLYFFTQIFSYPTFIRPKNFIGSNLFAPKFFQTQYVFSDKIFVYPKFLWNFFTDQ